MVVVSEASDYNVKKRPLHHCEPCRKRRSEGFHRVVELKHSGLCIYKYIPAAAEKGGNKAYPNNEEKDFVVLENKREKPIQRYDFVRDLCTYRSNCPKCKNIASKLQNLLQNISIIKQNEVIGVCDYCHRYSERGNCKRCQMVIGKFFDNRLQIEKVRIESLQNLIDDLLTFLNSIFSKDTMCEHLLQKFTHQRDELHKLIQRLRCHRLVENREVEISDAFENIEMQTKLEHARRANMLQDNLISIQSKLKHLKENFSFSDESVKNLLELSENVIGFTKSFQNADDRIIVKQNLPDIEKPYDVKSKRKDVVEKYDESSQIMDSEKERNLIGLSIDKKKKDDIKTKGNNRHLRYDANNNGIGIERQHNVVSEGIDKEKQLLVKRKDMIREKQYEVRSTGIHKEKQLDSERKDTDRQKHLKLKSKGINKENFDRLNIIDMENRHDVRKKSNREGKDQSPNIKRQGMAREIQHDKKKGVNRGNRYGIRIDAMDIEKRHDVSRSGMSNEQLLNIKRQGMAREKQHDKKKGVNRGNRYGTRVDAMDVEKRHDVSISGMSNEQLLNIKRQGMAREKQHDEKKGVNRGNRYGTRIDAMDIDKRHDVSRTGIDPKMLSRESKLFGREKITTLPQSLVTKSGTATYVSAKSVKTQKKLFNKMMGNQNGKQVFLEQHKIGSETHKVSDETMVKSKIPGDFRSKTYNYLVHAELNPKIVEELNPGKPEIRGKEEVKVIWNLSTE